MAVAYFIIPLGILAAAMLFIRIKLRMQYKHLLSLTSESMAYEQRLKSSAIYADKMQHALFANSSASQHHPAVHLWRKQQRGNLNTRFWSTEIEEDTIVCFFRPKNDVTSDAFRAVFCYQAFTEIVEQVQQKGLSMGVKRLHSSILKKVNAKTAELQTSGDQLSVFQFEKDTGSLKMYDGKQLVVENSYSSQVEALDVHDLHIAIRAGEVNIYSHDTALLLAAKQPELLNRMRAAMLPDESMLNALSAAAEEDAKVQPIFGDEEEAVHKDFLMFHYSYAS